MGCHSCYSYCGSYCGSSHGCSSQYYHHNHHWGHGARSCAASCCHASSCHSGHGCCDRLCSGVATIHSYKNMEHYHRSLSDSYRCRAEDIKRHLSI